MQFGFDTFKSNGNWGMKKTSKHPAAVTAHGLITIIVCKCFKLFADIQ